MQRMTMEWRNSLVALLLFLSFVYPCSCDTGRETFPVFEGAITEVFDKQNDITGTKRQSLTFGAPAFVGGVFNDKEFLAVICDAFYDTSPGPTSFEPVARTSNGNYKQWSSASVIFNGTVKKEVNQYLGKITAVMNKEKIYVLATSFDTSSTLGVSRDSDIQWDAFMIIGTLKNSSMLSSNGAVTIVWGKELSLKGLLKVTNNAQRHSYFIGGMGNGVVMMNGTIVLPIQIKHKNKKYDSASIIYSDDEGATWHMGKKTISGTSEGSVVEFEKGKLLLSVHSSSGIRAVYETNDMGDTWKTSQTFMAVWGNDPTRSLSGSQGSVITVPVGGKDVLLFSHPLNTEVNRTRDTLQLWVSDGKRIACVGTINKGKKGEHTGNSILAYVDKKLYVMQEFPSYAKKQNGDHTTGINKVIAVTPLDNYFESVKNTVLAWRKMDKKVVESGDISTDGLVGFLGNATKDDGVWPDKYNCVNATVTGATPVKGGFRFSGTADSGAKWPVASQGQNQLYMFTRKQFTLAATVKLHNTGINGGVMLLGASVNTPENNILFGIGCSKSNNWYTFYDKNEKHFTNLSCKLEKEYHVALTYANRVAHFYVNGSFLTKGKQTKSNTLVIQEFFMGKVENDLPAHSTMCTVKNVMLFNQRLEQKNIFQLFRVSNNSNLDDPLEAKETTPFLVSHPSAQTTQPAKKPVSHNSVQKTKKDVTIVISDKKLPAKTIKQTSVTEKHNIHNATKNHNRLDHFLHNNSSASLKKNMKPTDSSAISFAGLQLMCALCSLILLAQV